MFGSFDCKQQCFGPSACTLGMWQKPRAGMPCRVADEPRCKARGIGMAKQGSTASGVKTAPARSDQKGTGASAGIEIVGFPQKLYTRTFGDPDTLFVPLLEAARDANKMMERLTGLG